MMKVNFGLLFGIFALAYPFCGFCRNYDAQTGRFLTQDPIGYEAGDPNYYRYVYNNPVKFKDPTGLWCEYSQSGGDLRCFDNDTGEEYLNGHGYSGTGPGRDNPDAEIIRNVGPIPEGTYQVGDAEDRTGTQGPNVRPLTPMGGTMTYGRSGFLIHGNNSRNDASTGCVIAPPDIRTGIRNGELLYVRH